MPNVHHISHTKDIELFAPRPSPMAYDTITGPVVFAICEEKLHNYLLPRNCPRVCYYAGLNTAAADVERFITPHNARYIVCIEEQWRAQMENTVLYCYELPGETFELLDEIAGYYISYKEIRPVAVKAINNAAAEIALRPNVALLTLPSIKTLAEEVAASSLAFSLIRMHYAAV